MKITRSSFNRTYTKKQSIQCKHKQAEKERIARHERLIELIHLYVRTPQQEDKLNRMRKNTIMEIDLRFRKSQQAEQYIFPRTQIVEQSEEEGMDMGLAKKLSRNIYYDLKSQNQLERQPSQSQFLQLSRRVKSLEQVGIRSQKIIKKVKIGRLETQLYYKQYKNNMKFQGKKRSKTEKKQKLGSEVFFPILTKRLQNIKTQSPENRKIKVQKLISKKLITEAYSPISIKQLRGSGTQILRRKF